MGKFPGANLSEIEELKIEYWLILEYWKPKRLLTAQALINKLIWAIATEYDCLIRKRRRGFNPENNRQEYKGFHVVSGKNLKETIGAIAGRETLDWQLPIKGLVSSTARRWWQGASEEKKTFRSIRNQLGDLFGVCEIDRSNQEWQMGKDGNQFTRDMPILKGIDFEKLLLLYESPSRHCP